MIPEILFKGKRIDTGEWVEGHLLKSQINNNDYYIVADVLRSELIPIKPETICQYSGLTDSKDVKIFSGDKYKTSLENLYTVYFVNGAFCGGISEEECAPLGWMSEHYSNDLNPDNFHKEITVIGNIHDKEAT